MATFTKLIQHLNFQGKRDAIVKLVHEAKEGMDPGIPRTLDILSGRETNEFFREMLDGHTGMLGANHPSTLPVSESLDWVAMKAETHRCKENLVKQLEEVKRWLGANYPQILEASTMITTAITKIDEELVNILRLPSIPEKDAEERRWNDEKLRGWDDKLHGRLVSIIARYKERTRKGPQCDWWALLRVSCYCLYSNIEER